MDEAEGLSEENRALVERELGPVWADLLAKDPRLNRLLNAARTESRSTPDREGVARIVDPDEWEALDRGLITTKGRQLTATAALKARYCKRSLAKADAILALARPASSAGGVEEARPARPDLAIGAITVAMKTTTDAETKPWLQTALDFLTGDYEPLEDDSSKGADRG